MATDPDLLDADKRARRDALDIARSFIVQAPAGSGKTELLIQRYLRLLASVDEPEEVLAITFTRKAALEMQLRVLDALRKADQGIVGPTDHERFTIDLAAEVLVRDGKRGWALMEAPGRMRIQTVDAFGAGIARTAPLTSAIGGLAVTATDSQVNRLYRDAAKATLDYLVAGETAGDAVARVLTHLDNNTALYVNYVSRMLASREQWLAITGSGAFTPASGSAARRQLERNIEDVISRQLAALRDLMPPRLLEEVPALLRYASSNLGDRPEHPLAACTDVDELPSPTDVEHPAWRGIAGLLLTKQGTWRRQINRNDGFPPQGREQKQALFGLIEALTDCHDLRDGLHRARDLPEPRYRDDQWNVLLALFSLLPQAVAELKRLFGEQGLCDHNEVALAAGRALGTDEAPGEIVLALDYQIRHLLVDEMQDTSIAQYDLLRKLTAGWVPGDGRSIFCVGDPMQSIYRFRDAEVGEFLLARESGIGSLSLESLLLRRNFRSGENLVHWFNTVFLQVMPLKDDVSVGAISYAESIPVQAKSGSGEAVVHALFDADGVAEADRTLDVIRQCLGAGDGEDVAVLVRSRTQLRELLPALRREGIPYRAIEIDRLTDLPEIIDLLALTRAICHEGDRLAWLGLLRGPWVGLCWTDLHAIVLNDSDSTVFALICDTDRLERLSTDGRERVAAFRETIRPFLEPNLVNSLRDQVERAWHALGGPAMLANEEHLENVYRFLGSVSRLETAGTLEDVRELEEWLDAERVSSAGDADCRINIMTMHKAKGLQFDHVILPGLGRIARGNERDMLNWLTVPDATGRSEMILSPVGPRAELESDPLHRFIETTEREKTTMELDRLLYVACTRARTSLHLIGNVGVDAENERYRIPDSRSLLRRLWPALEPEFGKAFAAWTAKARPAESGTGSKPLRAPLLKRLTDPWQVPDILPIAGSTEDSSPPTDAQAAEVEFYWVGAAARHAGTIVHRWMQIIADGKPGEVAIDLETVRTVSSRWARQMNVPGDQLRSVCDRVQDAIRGALDDDRGRWILCGEGDSELPVTGSFCGRLESVVIDRVRIDADGAHWIIDYKTSAHEGGNLAGFLAQEEDRYRPQLQKYATMYAALTGVRPRAALYFPLLQVFREIDVEPGG